MIQIDWQGQQLDIGRLVFRPGDGAAFAEALTAAAARHRLGVADDRTDARPGDFWVGCHPLAGWGDADPDLVGWASAVEVPVAVHALRGAARSHVAAEPVTVFAHN